MILILITLLLCFIEWESPFNLFESKEDKNRYLRFIFLEILFEIIYITGLILL